MEYKMSSLNFAENFLKILTVLIIIQFLAIYLNMEKDRIEKYRVSNIDLNIEEESAILPGDTILYGACTPKNYRIFLNKDYINNQFSQKISYNSIIDAPAADESSLLIALKERARDIRTGSINHEIKENDTLTSIASLYGISEKSIKLRNSEILNNGFKKGLTLKIVPKAEYKYTVTPGDTLWSISTKYNIDSMDIIKSNNLTSPTLMVGQKLDIPWEKRDSDWRKKYNLPSIIREEQQRIASVAKKVSPKNVVPAPVIAKPVIAKMKPKKRFIRPVSGKFTVLSKYGNRFHPVYKRNAFHAGIDVRAKINTPLIAVSDGVVDYAGWMRGYGRIVVIKHGKKYSSRYAHLQKFKVKKGQKIRQGQIIGYSGNSGVVTGPHLHFEIREYGRTTNPQKFL
jgi:murein DD-endopeptidase MepM/ murein hydrolase activator NlpD